MKICMVLRGYFPPDIRVEKEAKVLSSVGHKVYVLSLGKEGMPEIENIDGINIIRIFPSKNLLSKLWRYLWFGIFFEDLLWKKALQNIIKQYEIDVVHVHDLPLVKTVVSTVKKFGIPVVADLHENYPEAVRVWKRKRK